MKLFVLALFALTAAVVAEENYDGPEWQPIDWSNVVYAHEVPGFWDDKTDFLPIVNRDSVVRNRRIVGGAEAVPNSRKLDLIFRVLVLIPGFLNQWI